MHKIIVEDVDIVLDKNNIFDVSDNSDVVMYLNGFGDVVINLGYNSKATIYHFGIDVSNKVEINLNCENACVKYYYNVINYNENKFDIIVNHNCCHTVSNIYNHGVNVLDMPLSFIVSGVVKKNINGCICNQENRIINIKDNKSTICPNLLIDSYDVNSSHSAYIGKFNNEILFYLMSRGLDLKKAYELLISGILLPDGVDKNKISDFVLELSKI